MLVKSLPLKAALAAALLALACSTAEAPERNGAPTHQQVSFSPPGETLALSGRLFGSGSVGAILAHQNGADQDSWLAFAQELAQQGYLVLTFDFRGYGQSPGKQSAPDAPKDLEGAVDFLRGKGVARPFLVGASMGGSASIAVAARLDVAGVVTLSTPLEFRGLDLHPYIEQVTEPKLFMASEGDTYATDSARYLYEHAFGESHMKVFPSSAHGTEMLTGVKGAEVKQSILDFIEKYK